MKQLLILIVIATLSIPVVNAGKNNDSIRIIGFNVYSANSTGGYGRSLSMNMSIEKDERHLEAGIIMQQESARVSGGEIIYRHYLSSASKNSVIGNKIYRNFRPYLQYNFVFRYNNTPDRINLNQFTMQEMEVAGGRVATYEHYAGIGTQLRIIDNLFLNAGLGYGTIIGSVDGKYLDEPHYNQGGRKTDYGLITRFGLGYFIRK